MSKYSKNIEEVFTFTASNELLRIYQSCIFVVPPNIQDEKELMGIYFNGLWINELGYFGANWDALRDVLSDVSWIPKEMKKVIIYHQDFPLITGKDRKIYLRILADTVELWKKNPNGSEYTKGPHEFIVVFPPECKSQIEGILIAE